MTLRIFDKYEVIRRLAAGGMGDIFLARQVGAAGFSRLAVLKSLRSEIVERDDFFAQFLNEARMSATLNHPNVVAVYEVDEYRGVYFIAMEYIEGTDLSTLLRATVAAHQRMPFRVAAGIVADAALGLHHAHEAPAHIVHRDVSPQNVMVRLDGIGKVVDFGIAAASDRMDAFSGRLQGKLRYMSPEQLTGAPLTGASDQFSLGVVLWELLSHERLFSGADATAVLREISAGGIRPPSAVAPHVPPALDAVVGRMLAIDPAARYGSLREVAGALRAFLGAAVDQQIGRFVDVMVGAAVRLRTVSLVPEPVTISGLLDAAEIRCTSCGASSSLRHRFCPECGAPRAERSRAASVVRPRPGGPVSSPPVAALKTLLREQAEALDDMLAGESREAVVVALRIDRVGGDARMDAHIVRALSDAMEPFDPAIVQLSATRAVLAFDRGAADPQRALRLCAELARAIERVEAGAVGVALGVVAAVELGPIEVLGAGSSSFALRGAAIDRARARLDELTLPGVVVSDGVAARVRGRAVLEDGRFVGFGADPAWTDRARIVGRRDELRVAKALLERAGRGRAGALLLVGAPGSGKSRVAEEIALLASKLGFVTVLCRAARGDGWVGAELLGETLRDGLSHLAIGDPAAGARARLELLDLSPEVAAQVAAALEGQPQTADLDGAMISALVALSRVQPLCWVIDDHHLADADARRALGLLRARMGDGQARIALVMTGDVAVADAEVVELAPLSDEKLLAVALQHAGGRGLPPPVAQVVLVRSAGNPGVAVAVIDAMIALGGMVRSGDLWRVSPSLVELELPHALDALLSAHLATLSRAGQVFVRVAAVIESPVMPEVVLGALRYGGDRAALVEEVLASRLVRRTAHQALEFVQAGVEARLRRGVLPEDQRKIHARVAALLAVDPSPSSATLAALSHHRLAAGDDVGGADAAVQAARVQPTTAAARTLWGRAIEAYQRGGAPRDRLLRAIAEATPVYAAHALEEAARLLERAGPGGEETVGYALALAARSAVQLARGRIAEAEADATRALACEARGLDRAPLVEAWARVLEERGRLSEAAERLGEAAKLYEDAEDAAALHRPLNALGRLYLRLGRRERALELLGAAREAARAAGSVSGEIAALINRAALAPSGQAQILLVEAAELARGAGDALASARIAYNLGALALDAGRIADAHAAFSDALRLATELGWLDGIALATHALTSARV